MAATGFFEWKAVARLRHPYRIAMKGGAPFALAGLWERWQPGGGPVIETFAIITTTANAIVAPIHDRMPAIIDRADYDAWLESTDVITARALLHPFAAENMSAHPVSTRVNNPQNDDPGCIAPE